MSLFPSNSHLFFFVHGLELPGERGPRVQDCVTGLLVPLADAFFRVKSERVGAEEEEDVVAVAAAVGEAERVEPKQAEGEDLKIFIFIDCKE